MKNIKKIFYIIGGICLLFFLFGLLSYEYYLWTSHDKDKDYRKIQECIETGVIEGSEQACKDMLSARKNRPK